MVINLYCFLDIEGLECCSDFIYKSIGNQIFAIEILIPETFFAMHRQFSLHPPKKVHELIMY